jgi:hypothetical protein
MVFFNVHVMMARAERVMSVKRGGYYEVYGFAICTAFCQFRHC